MEKAESSSEKRQKRLDAALRKAITQSDAASVEESLKNGANPRAFADDENAFNALMQAAFDNDERSLRIMLGKGGAKDANAKGETALMIAAWRGSEECLRQLLPISDANTQDEDGWNALMWATRRTRTGCMAELLPKTRLNAHDANGWTALMVAAQGHPESLELLLPGSDPEQRNSNDDTALMVALKLLKSGAIEDESALECARLLFPLSDLKAVNKDGESALSLGKTLEGESSQKLAQEMLALHEQRELQREIEAAEENSARSIAAVDKKAIRL